MRTGNAAKRCLNVFEVLEGQHRRRREHRDLLAVHHRLESGAHRHFGLAVADVAARAGGPSASALPCPVLMSAMAVTWSARELELERVFELALPVRVRGEGVPWHRFARGVELQQLLGHVAHRPS